MSIFDSILSKIFPGAQAKTAPAPAAPPASPADAAVVPPPAVNAAAPAPIPLGDVAAVLDAKPGAGQLNWRTSIVDLLKLLDLDSSLAARKQLAAELLYPGDTGDSAALNIWLHRQVLTRLAANGGTVPPELLD
ncbi:MAG: DUF3597 domain-containing protein [Comamonas sp.]